MSGDIDVEVTEIRAMTLTAYKLAILNRASNELAADGLSFEQQLEGAITKAISFLMDEAFFTYGRRAAGMLSRAV